MAKIIQVINSDSEGFRVRLSDGSYVTLPHDHQGVHVGEEVSGASEQQTTNMQDSAALRTAPEDSTDEPLPADPAGDGTTAPKVRRPRKAAATAKT